MNEQFRKKFSQTFKSHFDSDALLKLTDVYFVIAGNEARISFTRFWLRSQKPQDIKGSMILFLTAQ